MSNAEIGARFEREFCETLKNEGFWVLRIPQNAGGQQPADILAINRHSTNLIDCKVVSTNAGFPLSRVEDNQWEAMEAFEKKGAGFAYFAILVPEGQIRMVTFSDMTRAVREGKKRLTMEELTGIDYTYSRPMRMWLWEVSGKWK